MRSIGRALKSITAPSLGLLDPLCIPMRVWPSDLNLGMHMDNVRYLQLMNMARNELFLRSGIRRLMLRRRLGLPLAACEMRYRRSLLPWQRFELQTRIVGWDEKRFYIQQSFRRQDKVAAEGVFRCAFTQGSGVIAPATVFAELMGEAVDSPTRPEELPA